MLHLHLAQVFIKLLDQLLLINPHLISGSAEDFHSPILEFVAPGCNLGGMDSKLAGQLAHGFIPFERRQSHLCLKFIRESFTHFRTSLRGHYTSNSAPVFGPVFRGHYTQARRGLEFSFPRGGEVSDSLPNSRRAK